MRWLFRMVGAVLVLAVALLVGAALLPAEKIAGFAAREMSLRTGREVRFTGRIKPAFYPVLGVNVEGVMIGNADWSSSGPMLEAENLLVGVELRPLLSGDVKISELRVTNPVVRLERNRDGLANWSLTPAGSAATESSAGSGVAGLRGLSLADGRISNGRLIYSDQRTGAVMRLEKVDLTLALSGLSGPARVSGQAEYSGEMVTASADIAEFGRFLSGELAGLKLKAETGFARLVFDGRAGFRPLVADADLALAISDLARASRMAGRNIGFVKKLDLNGRFTLTNEGDAYLRGARLVADGAALAGDLDLMAGEPPKLSARLRAAKLDLTLVLGTSPEAAPKGGAPEESGWSKTKLAFDWLHALDAEVAFAADSVDLGRIRLGETRLRAKLDKGRLVLTLADVAAYGGNISGEYVINARGGLSMGGDIDLRAIRLQPFLIDMAGFDRLIANADLSLTFLTSGDSMDAMMRRLSGSGRMEIGAGELLGLDIAGMLRNLDASYRGEGAKTIFSSITGGYTIKDGVLLNEDLNFASNLVDAKGEGRVNIAARAVDYRLTPVRFSGRQLDEAGGVSVPLLITGPWSKLKFRPDLQGLLDAELARKRKEAEENLKADLERLRSEAEEKVQQQIDEALQDGRQRVLDELRKRLTGQ